MPGQRDKYDYSYDREVFPRDERNQWQNLTREDEGHNTQASLRPDRAVVPYAGNFVDDGNDTRQRRTEVEAYGRPLRRGYEDEAEYGQRVDPQRFSYDTPRLHGDDTRGRRRHHKDSEDSEDDRDHRRSKSHGAKQFVDDHFDIRSDMGLIAGVGGGLMGAVLGRKMGNQSTTASVAGAIAGAAAANALENQWMKHKKETDRRLDKAGKIRDDPYGQDRQKKRNPGKTQEKKDKK